MKAKFLHGTSWLGHPRWILLQTIWLWAVLASALAVIGEGVPSPEPKPKVAPPATWVVPLMFERLDRSAKVIPGEDSRLLLQDKQINAEENSTFIHSARQILTVSGVQNGADISIDFNPSYQSLTFHWVRLWRGSNMLNRLDLDKIKLIQPERELDQYLYSGGRSAVLILDDVRVGDIVDYACTLQGANPIFSGKFSADVRVQSREPVEHLATRLLWPSKRRIFTENHRCSVKPVISRKDEKLEFKWDFRKVPGLRAEDLLPAWFDPEPWVQITEFQTWAEVNQWATNLFGDTASLSAELTQQVEKWRKTGSREQQVLAVLRFIQDEVRYFGIEIGASSHQPADPSVVFSRRYGDCKDKVRLFVSIMRALHIEASPVLVNTEARRSLQEWKPTAGAFDHVIVQVRLDGKTYWLDPTAGYQRGQLAARYLPDYERGLVVQPKTTELCIIPHATGMPQTTVQEYFQLSGKTDPASLKIVTIAEGRDADRLRAQFATTPRDDIEKGYLTFYSRIYPGIKKTGPVQMSDDERQNRVEVTEYYSIEKIWSRSDRDGAYHCHFFPHTVDDLLKKPVDMARAMPLGVRFPEHQIVRTEVQLPEAWPAYSKTRDISDPAFSFHSNVTSRGRQLLMEYEYTSLASAVPLGRVTDYVRQLNEASETLGYSLSWQ